MTFLKNNYYYITFSYSTRCCMGDILNNWRELIIFCIWIFLFHNFVIAPRMKKAAKIKKQNLANAHLTKEKLEKIVYYLNKTREDMSKKTQQMSENDFLRSFQFICWKEQELLTEVNSLLRKEKNELKALEKFEPKVIEMRNQCLDFLASLQQSPFS